MRKQNTKEASSKEGKEKRERSSWAKHALDGDSSFTKLFHFLWKKNKNLESCPDVKIPDTIVYEHNFPTGWYYSVGNTLNKKTGKELETKAIGSDFTRQEDKLHGIIASFLSQTEDGMVFSFFYYRNIL